MNEDKTETANDEGELISLTENHEIEFWTSKFGVSDELLVEAIRRVGHSEAAVRTFLRHPHAEAHYQIHAREAMGFAVEVTIPGMNPTMVSGFATKQAAGSWIAEHRKRVASGPLRPRYRRPPQAANDDVSRKD
jgi:hypothetical protein